jgi:hypothetical protein
MSLSTGYEGPGPSSGPGPGEQTWEVEEVLIGGSGKYVVILLDKNPIGGLRLPSEDHIKWVKEKLSWPQ